MRASTSLLLLPLLASSSFALPNPKTQKKQKPLFKPIRRELAGAGYSAYKEAIVEASSSSPAAATATVSTTTFTGIAVASPSASTSTVADSLSPYSGTSSNTTTSSSNSTGLDTVNPNPGNLPSESISALLAQTTAYNTFSFTTYTPTTSTSAASSAVTAGAGDKAGDDDVDESSSSSDPLADALRAAESYADSLIGSLLPTITLDVILVPTQVSLLLVFLVKSRLTTVCIGARWIMGIRRARGYGWTADRFVDRFRV